MKKTLFILAALSLVLSAPAYAMHHEEKTPEQQAEYIQKKVEKMSGKLDLSAEQRTQYEAILKTKMEKKTALKKTMKAEKEKISEEYRAKVKGILSVDQTAKFDNMMAKYEKKMGKKNKKFLFF